MQVRGQLHQLFARARCPDTLPCPLARARCPVPLPGHAGSRRSSSLLQPVETTLDGSVRIRIGAEHYSPTPAPALRLGARLALAP
jgi:hypothetical protein